MSDNSSSKKSIISSTMWVSLLAVFIKFLGLVKQSVLAAYCGATEETDMFFIVSGVLVSLCTMIFSAISVSLLTMHTDKLIHEGRSSSNDLINKVLRSFLPVSVLITILFILAAPWVAKFLAPTYSHEQIEVMAKYIRMMSAVFILWCYFLTINVVLETDKRFIPGRGQNLFQNIFLILAAIFVYSRTGIGSLIWAFLLSAIAECVLVTWCARKQFRLIWGRLQTPSSEIKNLYKLALPLIIGSAVYEVNDIVDKQISSSLGEGNVSYLTYGSTINEIVTGVIVMAMSMVLFAHFSTWVSEGKKEKVERYLKQCLSYLTLLIMPIMALCLFAGKDIVRILYARGSFGETEVYYTYWVAAGYAIGFVFASARAIMVKVFYAFQDTRRPMLNGVVSVVLNIALSITLSLFLGVWGVSLATSFAMLFSVLYMMKQIKVHLEYFNLRDMASELIKGVVAFIVCSMALYLFSVIYTPNNLFIRFCLEGIIAFVAYLISLVILNSNSINDLRKIVSK